MRPFRIRRTRNDANGPDGDQPVVDNGNSTNSNDPSIAPDPSPSSSLPSAGTRSPATSDTRTDDHNEGSSTSSSSTSGHGIRSLIGAGVVGISDAVNGNLVAARYGTVAAVGLLAAYGVAHSPLLFRYRTASDVPPHHFFKRRSIPCRVVRVPPVVPSPPQRQRPHHHQLPLPQQQGPFRFDARHLSPLERVLPLHWYDRLMRMHPTHALTGKRPDARDDELIRVEVAGIQRPPDYFSYDRERPGDWFEGFVSKRPVVRCQLLARRVERGEERAAAGPGAATHRGGTPAGGGDRSNDRRFDVISNLGTVVKRRIPELSDGGDNQKDKHDQNNHNNNNETLDRDRCNGGGHETERQIAVCKVYYRTSPFQLLPTDLALHMVQNGRANALSDGVFYPSANRTINDADGNGEERERSRRRRLYDLDPSHDGPTTKPVVGPDVPVLADVGPIVEASTSIRAMRRDAAYASKLHRAEHEAAKASKGMWADTAVSRRHRPDVVEEVEFQANAPWYRKLWRTIRGG